MCAAWLLAGFAQAQAIYRIVGPDGRVTFSDRPASSAASNSNSSNSGSGGASSQTEAASGAAASPAALMQLPYELRQTATRFPVTLYATQECSPCDEARSYLKSRGIPFSERTVQSPSDVAALKKLSGQENLPFATIGSQHLKGFNEDSWGQYLKAAGYPAQSALPPNYRAPAARPLTPPAPAEKPQPVQAGQATQGPANAASSGSPSSAGPATPPPGTPTPSNPAGLRF